MLDWIIKVYSIDVNLAGIGESILVYLDLAIKPDFTYKTKMQLNKLLEFLIKAFGLIRSDCFH